MILTSTLKPEKLFFFHLPQQCEKARDLKHPKAFPKADEAKQATN